MRDATGTGVELGAAIAAPPRQLDTARRGIKHKNHQPDKPMYQTPNPEGVAWRVALKKVCIWGLFLLAIYLTRDFFQCFAKKGVTNHGPLHETDCDGARVAYG